VNQRPPSTRNATNTSQPDTEHVYIPGQQKLFAVKEFRKRRSDETPRNYMKKVTSEFCIGSSLHHENVIETLDLIFEGEKVYEIMEYCPYDLFKFVAMGEMDLDEIFCWFKQICQGVSYIHSLGISHRDLKLENVMLTETGIVKLIDFGCATVFKAPFQKNPNKLTGVYGSDPYIAPEVFSKNVPYDAEAADVWSIGIMYMCMTLLKFPWRIADGSTDTNYKNYATFWPRGRDKLFVQLPKLKHEGRQWIEGLMEIHPDLRPRLVDLLDSDWGKSIEVCRPGLSRRETRPVSFSFRQSGCCHRPAQSRLTGCPSPRSSPFPSPPVLCAAVPSRTCYP
ncbi:Serine/threonine-protein kinase oca2, partial [Smittium mucronatum]